MTESLGLPTVPANDYGSRDWELKLSYPGLRFSLVLAGSVEDFREMILKHLDKLEASILDAKDARTGVAEKMLPHAQGLFRPTRIEPEGEADANA